MLLLEPGDTENLAIFATACFPAAAEFAAGFIAADASMACADAVGRKGGMEPLGLTPGVRVGSPYDHTTKVSSSPLPVSSSISLLPRV